ncbi:putative bifunctional diguanylate cyclase/phosphodiesterase [Shewanella sp.]|uniref:putative bifunctional diguanylate cyclase/phosphodiesterase n=1 Tax=Shewanella sp. TaxID=50422 RepID=UPI004053FC2C
MEDWALARLNTQQIDLSSQSQLEAYGQLTRNELVSICSQLNCDAAFVAFHHVKDYQALGGLLPQQVRWLDSKLQNTDIAEHRVYSGINNLISALLDDSAYLDSVFTQQQFSNVDNALGASILPQQALEALRSLTEYSLAMSQPCKVGDTWLVLGVITHKSFALVLDKHAYHLASSLELQALSFSIAKKDRQYQELFQQLPIPCALIDNDNRVTRQNHVAKNCLSLELAASVFTLLEVDDHPMLHDTLHIVREGLLRQAWCEVPLLISGLRTWFKLSFCHALDEKGQLLMLAEDITERYRLADQLSFHSNHDVLTGLPNRVQFELLLSEALQDNDSSDACVAFLDLDQFQVINDISGHQAGDELLCQVAKRLKLLLRKGDVVARLGGDEFGILMYSASQESATMVAKRICHQLSEHEFQWRKVKHNVSVSMGLAKLDKNAGDIYSVLSQIDASCRLAKEEGRNQWHFYNEDDPQISKLYNQMLASVDIIGALALNEFELFYQLIEPLEKSETGLHMEVLLRMVQKDGTYVSPAVFLPAAERYNLASRIDRWVIEHLLKWGAANLEIWQQLAMVSINLSALSLGDQKFMSWLEMRLMVEPELVDKLCFEITETAAVSQLDQATALIDFLQPLGCKLALDDFGSGFSSFAYLKCLDVDFVKIDGQFVVNVCHDKGDKAIVAAICQLGKEMEFEVIAEFVENVDIGYLLKSLGVDYAQGYAINKPQKLSSLTSGQRTPWLISDASFYCGADI